MARPNADETLAALYGKINRAAAGWRGMISSGSITSPASTNGPASNGTTWSLPCFARGVCGRRSRRSLWPRPVRCDRAAGSRRDACRWRRRTGPDRPSAAACRVPPPVRAQRHQLLVGRPTVTLDGRCHPVGVAQGGSDLAPALPAPASGRRRRRRNHVVGQTPTYARSARRVAGPAPSASRSAANPSTVCGAIWPSLSRPSRSRSKPATTPWCAGRATAASPRDRRRGLAESNAARIDPATRIDLGLGSPRPDLRVALGGKAGLRDRLVALPTDLDPPAGAVLRDGGHIAQPSLVQIGCSPGASGLYSYRIRLHQSAQLASAWRWHSWPSR